MFVTQKNVQKHTYHPQSFIQDQPTIILIATFHHVENTGYFKKQKKKGIKVEILRSSQLCKGLVLN